LNNSTLQKANVEALNQLVSVVEQFQKSDYAKPLVMLSNNSIGMHIRHILEFYECLLNGYENEIVEYDNRPRRQQLEESPFHAIAFANELNLKLQHLNDKPLTLNSNLSYATTGSIPISSSYFRELTFTNEHTIHHFAILKIVLISSFPEIELPENFGLAYSTIRNITIRN
jgi:hypothetical protein